MEHHDQILKKWSSYNILASLFCIDFWRWDSHCICCWHHLQHWKQFSWHLPFRRCNAMQCTCQETSPVSRVQPHDWRAQIEQTLYRVWPLREWLIAILTTVTNCVISTMAKTSEGSSCETPFGKPSETSQSKSLLPLKWSGQNKIKRSCPKSIRQRLDLIYPFQ